MSDSQPSFDASMLDAPAETPEAAAATASRIRSEAFASGSRHPYMNNHDAQHRAWVERVSNLDAVAGGAKPRAPTAMEAARAQMLRAQTNPALHRAGDPEQPRALEAFHAAVMELTAAEAGEANPLEAAVLPPETYSMTRVAIDPDLTDGDHVALNSFLGKEGHLSAWLRAIGASQAEANALFHAWSEILPHVKAGTLNPEWLAGTRSVLSRQLGDAFDDKVAGALQFVRETAGQEAHDFLSEIGLSGHGFALHTLIRLAERRSLGRRP